MSGPREDVGMLRLMVIWVLVAVSVTLMLVAWHGMRTFRTRHAMLDGLEGLRAFGALVRRQMWFSVMIVALILAIMAASFAWPHGPGANGATALAMLVYSGIFLVSVPFLLREQRAVRAIPCESEATRERREAMVAIWLGAFIPPRDIAVAVDERAVAPPPAAHAPGIARIAGMTTIIFVVIHYFARMQPGQGGGILPFEVALLRLGLLAAVAIIMLGILTRRGSVVGAWALLAAHGGDRVAWLVMGWPASTAWLAGSLGLAAFYAWAAIASTKAHREGAAAVGKVFN